jgi:hypothetical protein
VGDFGDEVSREDAKRCLLIFGVIGMGGCIIGVFCWKG